MTPRADNFRAELRDQLRAAELAGKPVVDINAGDLHKKIGSYPGPAHRMPVCCEVMRAERRPGDEIVSSPPKGTGPSLTIRYRLPRERANRPEASRDAIGTPESKAKTFETQPLTLEEQIRLENIKADYQRAAELAIEQYRGLRSEVQELAKSITNAEVLAVGALFAYYAWIMTHCIPDVSTRVPPLHYSLQWVWVIPIPLPILGFFRSRRHMGQIHYIAKYIRDIEDQFADSGLPIGPEKGWEHFIDRHRKKWFGSSPGFWIFQASHFCLWLLLFAGTLLIALTGNHLGSTCVTLSGV